ncbi:L,D-transpeptidase family protein [Sphingobium sp.]|uniref:L,D-transpeptidase family protein n=1 Tax=Sphingobium sp. TaxID=1912891 RepID=UPI002D106E2B|nr:L,D-transpeptidase family protein [Sphingobium sp.]HUD91066.1 L,D-transpeptidase family protein [Sphingobium sp.]
MGTVKLILASFAVAGLLGFSGDVPVSRAGAGLAELPVRQPLAMDAAVQQFYHERNGRALWTGSSAVIILHWLRSAAEEGLDPASFDLAHLLKLSRDPLAAPAFDRALSRSFVTYLHALRSPTPGATTTYVDARLAPETRPLALLEAAAAAPSQPAHLVAIRRMHPLYEGLRNALLTYRQRGGAISGPNGNRTEQRLLANMDRLRALPADPGDRYILVDTASAHLWMIEKGRPPARMRVIVGSDRHPTPLLAGLIRYVVRNPYWNLPPDLVRARAAAVVENGPDRLAEERLELLSDWGPDAHPLTPQQVNWRAVARGEAKLRMRQRPGRDNMMGTVKFMLPNRLGIYLHDTRGKTAFTRSQRRLSSGCVRVEDAARLEAWLLGGRGPAVGSDSERRIDLPAPVPVYMLYLTAIPGQRGVSVRADAYGRDRVAAQNISATRIRSDQDGLTILGPMLASTSAALNARILSVGLGPLPITISADA